MGRRASVAEVVAVGRAARRRRIVDGGRAAAAISLSHRNGRALAVVADPGLARRMRSRAIEPRSGAFVSTWLTPDEQRAAVEPPASPDAQALANLIWAAKEAAAKARREGLRLDVGRAAVELRVGAGRRR